MAPMSLKTLKELEEAGMINFLARALERLLNDDDKSRPLGFALFVYEHGPDSGVSYVSNTERASVAEMLRITLQEWEQETEG